MSDVVDLGPAAPQFPTAPAVAEAVLKAAHAPSFRYTRPGAHYVEAAAAWQRDRHGWNVDAADALFIPKTTHLMTALINAGPTFYELAGGPEDRSPMSAAAAMEMGAPREVVLGLAQQEADSRVEATADNGVERAPVIVALSPTYGRVAQMLQRSGAELRLVRMEDFGGRLRINWPALENAMIGADYLWWINPHNPTGRIFSEDELKKVGYLAEIYRVTVISDDIHADFARAERPYIPMAKACPFLFEAGRLIHTTSPTITFAMSGIEAAVVFARGKARENIEAAKSRLSLSTASYFAQPAAIAAWRDGGAYVDQIAATVAQNQRDVAAYLREHLPATEVADADGSMLLWFNAGPYLEPDADLSARCAAAGVSVTPGGQFGETWQSWIRLSLALPHEDAMEGAKRLVLALTNRAV